MNIEPSIYWLGFFRAVYMPENEIPANFPSREATAVETSIFGMLHPYFLENRLAIVTSNNLLKYDFALSEWKSNAEEYALVTDWGIERFPLHDFQFGMSSRNNIGDKGTGCLINGKLQFNVTREHLLNLRKKSNEEKDQIK